MSACVSFELPLQLVNGTNAREHWSKRSERAKRQRSIARMATLSAKGIMLVVESGRPWIITITRLAPSRGLDSDSLPPSAKHVRDGIADALCIDDGDESQATWLYRQERAPEFGVRVEIHTELDP